MTRILVIDDHQAIRKQVRKLIQLRSDWAIVGECENGQEAVEQHAALRPHVAVIDFNMPKLNGLKAARQILEDTPSALILMLSISDSQTMVEEVKKAGIRGFCSKSNMGVFLEAVEAILRGETYFHEKTN